MRLLPPYAALLLACSGCISSVSLRRGGGHTAFQLREGDLLFQDLDAGPLCEAIEKVTTGHAGAHLTHVGIVCEIRDTTVDLSSDWRRDSVRVLEAVADGVVVTPLDAFLARSQDEEGRPKVLVGRLRPSGRRSILQALRRGRALLGKPYDAAFAVSNDAYYCSELVYEMFRYGAGGDPLFGLQPMTFVDPATGRVFPPWQRYFERQGIPVPEGAPGINPAAMSRSAALKIVYAYGHPEGWRPGE